MVRKLYQSARGYQAGLIKPYVHLDLTINITICYRLTRIGDLYWSCDISKSKITIRIHILWEGLFSIVGEFSVFEIPAKTFKYVTATSLQIRTYTPNDDHFVV
jgi:hypothetical protein